MQNIQIYNKLKPSNTQISRSSNTIKQSMKTAGDIQTSITILDSVSKDTEAFIKAKSVNGTIDSDSANATIKIIGAFNEYLKIINNNMYNITERIALLESIVVSKNDLIKNLESLHPLMFPPPSQLTASQQQQQQASSTQQGQRPGQPYTRG
jgi:hypothetical protein